MTLARKGFLELLACHDASQERLALLAGQQASEIHTLECRLLLRDLLGSGALPWLDESDDLLLGFGHFGTPDLWHHPSD
jgi:hypothetical protein